MAPAQILPVCPGDRILDLCAAPGGKATELGARLSAGGGLMPPGLLAANEISASRAKALLHNVELFGIPNALVTNETPARLAQRFPAYFDAVLVDAPCSGEGMFRKDPEAAKAWYPAKVQECAAVQREIILHAADMLRPGGYMVYSTCTFEPAENELVLLHLLRERPQMELVPVLSRPIPEKAREAFAPALRWEELLRCGAAAGDVSERDAEKESGAAAEGIAEREAGAASGTTAENDVCAAAGRSGIPDLSAAVRLWPHRTGGEGHFIALLRKKGEELPEGPEGRAWRCGPGSGRDEMEPGRRKRKGKGGRAAGSGQAGAGGMSREEKALLNAFLQRIVPGEHIDESRLENHGGMVYLMPEGLPDLRGLTFLRGGLYLGQLKKNRFEPAQELAMALPPGSTGKGRISFPQEDERLSAYLRGEPVRIGETPEPRKTIETPEPRETMETQENRKTEETPEIQEALDNGWYLVCVDGYPLGWGKLTGNTLKNKLPAGWRT